MPKKKKCCGLREYQSSKEQAKDIRNQEEHQKENPCKQHFFVIAVTYLQFGIDFPGEQDGDRNPDNQGCQPAEEEMAGIITRNNPISNGID